MNSLDLIKDVEFEITVELGKTQKSIKEILELTPGSILELDRFINEPVNIYANGKLIGIGIIVVINDNYGIKILQLYK